MALLLVLENNSASHYNDACKPVSVCELLRIENSVPRSCADVCTCVVRARESAAEAACLALEHELGRGKKAAGSARLIVR